MKSIKPSLVLAFVAASALVSAAAAEELVSSHDSAHGSHVVANPGTAATTAPKAVVGSPRGLSNLPAPSTPSNAGGDTMEHCKTPQKAHCHMSCCG